MIPWILVAYLVVGAAFMDWVCSRSDGHVKLYPGGRFLLVVLWAILTPAALYMMTRRTRA